MKHNDAMQHVIKSRVCDRHRMMTLFSNAEQVSAKRNIMEPGESSRSARNVATSVVDDRAATIEHVPSKPPTSLTSLWFAPSAPGLAY